MHIKLCIRFIFCIIFFLSCVQKVNAQVNVQDSLALVALYNKIPALASDTTWLNGDVSTWHGVSVFSNRVQYLDLSNVVINDSIPREICGLTALFYLELSNCQLKGNIPRCLLEMPTLGALYVGSNQLTGVESGADFSQWTQIQNISIANNLFTEMPDFISITSSVLNSIDTRFNYFNFDDLIPLTSKALNLYLYEPQHELSQPQLFTVNVGDTTDFPDASLIATGTGNIYNWRLLGGGDTTYTPPGRFINTNTPVMRVEGAQLADNHLYHCEMTNPSLPGLVLKTGVIDMMVIDPFLPQTITYQSDTFALCNALPLQLAASTNAGKTVSFISLNDTIATVNPDNTLSVHKPGTVIIRATALGDTTYHAASLDVIITIVTQIILPVIEITEQLPTEEGGDLQLSVQDIPGLSYAWSSPSQTSNASAITVSPLTSADLGTYSVRVTEGSCLRSELSIAVDQLIYGKLIIYELITPNGDSDNEIFYIKNLDPSLYNEVSVYNATHQIVYHQENYRNDWDGGNLPVGSYYYLVKYGEQTYKGNLYIKR